MLLAAVVVVLAAGTAAVALALRALTGPGPAAGDQLGDGARALREGAAELRGRLGPAPGGS